MRNVQIRAARPEETEMLSSLCRRSKAHWGYDAAFMRLSEAALTVTGDMIARGRVLVAESGEAVAGVASVEALDVPGDYDLVHLFVEPARIGTGVGAALFDAAAMLAKREGAARLVILSDPFAAPFYRRMGAVEIGDAPSDAVPDRRLPLLVYELT